jgi:prepilin-type N-terminal cleavage/methylation domain-containing protein
VTGLAHTLFARTRARLESEDGFTLIELINVMLIMGILMSISFSAYTTLHTRAEQKSAISNLSVIRPQISLWRQDYGNYATISMPLLNTNYLNNSIDITFFDLKPENGGVDYCAQYTVPTGDFVATMTTDGTITVGGPTNVCP